MRKPVRIIGTTIAAAAIVGATGAAASAHEGFDHGFGGRASFGGHAGFDHHGFSHGDHASWSDRGGDFGDDSHSDGSFAPSAQTGSGSDDSNWGDHSWGDPGRFDHHWWGSDFAHHGWVTADGDQDGTDQSTDAQQNAQQSPWDHQAPTFDQRKAAVVAALQAADARLTALQDKLTSAAASNDPTGFAPKALPYVTQARAQVESLLSQVQSATTDQQLAQILQRAPSAWTQAPTPAT